MLLHFHYVLINNISKLQKCLKSKTEKLRICHVLIFLIYLHCIEFNKDLVTLRCILTVLDTFNQPPSSVCLQTTLLAKLA